MAKKKMDAEERKEYKGGKYMGGPAEEKAEKKKGKRMAMGGQAGGFGGMGGGMGNRGGMGGPNMMGYGRRGGPAGGAMARPGGISSKPAIYNKKPDYTGTTSVSTMVVPVKDYASPMLPAGSGGMPMTPGLRPNPDVSSGPGLVPPGAGGMPNTVTGRMPGAMRGGGLARKGVGQALAKGGLVKGAGCAQRGVKKPRIV